METQHPLAVKYNDQSVLENHHIASTFAVAQKAEFNIFKLFSKEQFKSVRERMVSMVLATDMAKHFSDLGKLKSRVHAPGTPPPDSAQTSTRAATTSRS